jgi:hypothetical protein
MGLSLLAERVPGLAGLTGPDPVAAGPQGTSRTRS